VTRLILLNGPPGIGKSTLSALYTDRHPGTLNLDIDSLHRLVGGWQDPENRTHDVLRPVALAMASTHLGGGRDVILPQYLSRVDEIEAFSAVARNQGAEFHEIVLLDEKSASIDRFQRRQDDSDWGVHNRRLVELSGGPAMLAGLYDQLMEILPRRPAAVLIRSERQAIDDTYAQLVQAVGAPSLSPG
jgi:predicted kinase